MDFAPLLLDRRPDASGLRTPPVHQKAVEGPSGAVAALFERDPSALGGYRPSSYPEDRHLVGICPSLTDLRGGVQGGAVPPASSAGDELPVPPYRFTRSEPLPAGEGKTEAAWAREQLDWEHVFLTRSVLAQFDQALLAPCADEGRVLQHSMTDRQRLTPYRCQRRCTCPACGRSYGQGKAAELVSLLSAVMAPGRLVLNSPEVKAWHMVLSNDTRVSAFVDELVQAGEVDQLRKVLRHLTEDVQATLVRVFGAGVAAVVVFHWWASSDPLRGRGHLHAHVTVPNVAVVDGLPVGVLRHQGVLDQGELDTLKHEYASAVARHRWARIAAPDLDARPFGENVHVKFSTALEGGRNSIAHRMRYDARHPVVDLLAVTEPAALRDTRRQVDGFYTADLEGAEIAVHRLDSNPEGLEWWCRSAQIWQGIQTTRYTGWLVNSTRKKLGLIREVEEETEHPEWSTVGVYRVHQLGAQGVTVERWNQNGRYEQVWHGDHVQLLPPASVSSTWTWNNDLRPERKAGPPEAWLKVFEPRPFELAHDEAAAYYA